MDFRWVNCSLQRAPPYPSGRLRPAKVSDRVAKTPKYLILGDFVRGRCYSEWTRKHAATWLGPTATGSGISS